MAVCPAGHESTATDFCDTCGMRIEGAAISARSAATGATPAGQPDPAGVAGTGPGSLAGSAQRCPQCGTERSGQFCEACGFDYATGAPARAAASASVGTAAPSTAAPGTAMPAPATLGPAAADPTQARATPAIPGLASPGSAAPGLASPGSAAPGPGPVGATPAAPATLRPDPAQVGPAGAGQAWSAVVTADRAYYNSVIAAGGPDAGSIVFPAYCPERRFVLTGKEMRIGRRSASRGLEPEIDLTGPPTDPGVSHLHAVLIAQPDGTWSVLDPGSSNGTRVNAADIDPGVPVPLHDGDHILLGAWTRLAIEIS